MLQILQEGGVIIWLLFILGGIASVIFFERIFHLHRACIKPEDFLKGIYNVLKRKNIVEAVSLCEDTPGPIAEIVMVAILNHNKPNEEIKKVIEEVGLSEIPRLERNLNLLLTIAKVSPLLGLLGTVLGMMEIFDVIYKNAPLIHSGLLSKGLWHALLATATGLSVAIPCYVSYNFLISIVENIVLDMQKTAVDIYTFLSELGKSELGKSEQLKCKD